MEKRLCTARHKLFPPGPQSLGQKFCSGAECQRERKRRWQKACRASDPDYRDNDIQANRNWRSQHPGNWCTYRRRHPQLVIRNRDKQCERDWSRRLQPPLLSPTPHLANEGASSLHFPLDIGTFRMIPVTEVELVNKRTDHTCFTHSFIMNSWIGENAIDAY
jgi:hypothetical protein